MNYTYDYPRPAVSADIALFRHEKQSLHILLIQRKNPPFQGMWALPGGFMEIDETLEETATRELEEETGLKNVELKQFKTFSQVDRDPRTRIVTTVFFGIVPPENSVATGGDDAESAEWFNVDDLPPVGFDHARIIGLLLEQIKKEH
ncbi:MAG: NUDIX hydrolase [Bacteroidales bacterium]|nr:NUDIX hydrolase [Bacteroidales bacterium]